jgi:uncharacterized protein YbjT (DUF2867 family)
MSIVINTPTSNIGRALVARLLDAGERVTVLSRDKTKVDDFHRRGARVVEGSFEEPALLAEALEGAEALFWLTPPPARPDYYAWATKCAKQAAAAAKKAGTRRAVVLSSMGAHSGPGTGVVGPAREMENDFEAALPAVVSLRPRPVVRVEAARTLDAAALGVRPSACPTTRGAFRGRSDRIRG